MLAGRRGEAARPWAGVDAAAAAGGLRVRCRRCSARSLAAAARARRSRKRRESESEATARPRLAGKHRAHEARAHPSSRPARQRALHSTSTVQQHLSLSATARLVFSHQLEPVEPSLSPRPSVSPRPGSEAEDDVAGWVLTDARIERRGGQGRGAARGIHARRREGERGGRGRGRAVGEQAHRSTRLVADADQVVGEVLRGVCDEGSGSATPARRSSTGPGGGGAPRRSWSPRRARSGARTRRRALPASS